MLPVFILATCFAAATPIAPITVQFTSDSVYKNEGIIVPKDLIKEEESELYTIVLEEDKLLGYTIYDNPDTAYIDGLKFDDEFVSDWVVQHVDFTVEHVIHIKTVYTDDIAGMLAAAKNGDWSIALSNPLVLIQLIYYILAAGSVILGGFGLLKAKKSKIKTVDEITAAITTKATNTSKALETKVIELATSLVTPVFEKLKSQNQAIIEALVLAQSGDKDSKLALINLLKSTASDDITLLSEAMKKTIEEADLTKQKIKAEADKLVEEISEGNFDGASTEDVGGIHI